MSLIAVRGATIEIRITFKDARGGTVTPAGALGKLTYRKANAAVTVDLIFALDGNSFVVSWDSKVADAGRVDWAARSADGSPYSAVQGDFSLTANAANAQLA